MQTINTPPEAEAAIVGFLISPGTGLPDGLMTKLGGILSARQGLDRIIAFIEQIYAYRSIGLNNEARGACGALAKWCFDLNFWAFGLSGRGIGIARAMQRDMGEEAPQGAPWPAEADDPATDPQFVPMVPQEVTTTIMVPQGLESGGAAQ